MNSKTGHDNVPVLKVSGLKLTYADEDLPVLTGVDLKLYPQELRIIVGPSGCGKSTLVSAICGFIPHSIEGMVTGTITINGKDNLNRSIYEIASDISLVQQDPEAQLCTNDVYHELAFALENFLVPEAELKHQVNWVIRELGLKQLRNRPLHLLSGGEKQKVALASVLVLKPKVLVFDEPTANLDPNAAAEFLKLIDRVRKNTKVGILIVDHNPSQYYDIADHILVLNKGKIEHILSSHEYKKFDAQYYQPLFKFSEPPRKSSVMLQNDQARIVANARKLKELNLKPQENEIIRIKDLNFSYGTNHVLKISQSLLIVESS